MPEEDLVDVKFRLYDGSDIGPFRYSATSTVDMLKQRIVSDWPKGLLSANPLFICFISFLIAYDVFAVGFV